MRLKRLRRNAQAAWLGIAALVLNALVPVHLAFDLADALGAAPHHAGAGWRLLARISGHHGPADHHDRSDHDRGHHRPTDCPVCSALGALAGLAPAAPPQLLLPPAPAGAPAVLPSEEQHAGGAVAAYRSRAPPTA